MPKLAEPQPLKRKNKPKPNQKDGLQAHARAGGKEQNIGILFS